MSAYKYLIAQAKKERELEERIHPVAKRTEIHPVIHNDHKGRPVDQVLMVFIQPNGEKFALLHNEATEHMYLATGEPETQSHDAGKCSFDDDESKNGMYEQTNHPMTPTDDQDNNFTETNKNNAIILDDSINNEIYNYHNTPDGGIDNENFNHLNIPGNNHFDDSKSFTPAVSVLKKEPVLTQQERSECPKIRFADSVKDITYSKWVTVHNSPSLIKKVLVSTRKEKAFSALPPSDLEFLVASDAVQNHLASPDIQELPYDDITKKNAVLLALSTGSPLDESLDNFIVPRYGNDVHPTNQLLVNLPCTEAREAVEALLDVFKERSYSIALTEQHLVYVTKSEIQSPGGHISIFPLPPNERHWSYITWTLGDLLEYYPLRAALQQRLNNIKLELVDAFLSRVVRCEPQDVLKVVNAYLPRLQEPVDIHQHSLLELAAKIFVELFIHEAVAARSVMQLRIDQGTLVWRALQPLQDGSLFCIPVTEPGEFLRRIQTVRMIMLQSVGTEHDLRLVGSAPGQPAPFGPNRFALHQWPAHELFGEPSDLCLWERAEYSYVVPEIAFYGKPAAKHIHEAYSLLRSGMLHLLAEECAPQWRSLVTAGKLLTVCKHPEVSTVFSIDEDCDDFEAFTPLDLSQPGEASTLLDLSQPGEISTLLDLSQPSEASPSLDLDQPGEASTPLDLSQPGEISTLLDLSQPGEISTLLDLSEPEGFESPPPLDLSQPESFESSTPLDVSQPEHFGMNFDQYMEDVLVPLDLNLDVDETDAIPLGIEDLVELFGVTTDEAATMIASLDAFTPVSIHQEEAETNVETADAFMSINQDAVETMVDQPSDVYQDDAMTWAETEDAFMSIDQDAIKALFELLDTSIHSNQDRAAETNVETVNAFMSIIQGVVETAVKPNVVETADAFMSINQDAVEAAVKPSFVETADAFMSINQDAVETAVAEAADALALLSIGGRGKGEVSIDRNDAGEAEAAFTLLSLFQQRIMVEPLDAVPSDETAVVAAGSPVADSDIDCLIDRFARLNLVDTQCPSSPMVLVVGDSYFIAPNGLDIEDLIECFSRLNLAETQPLSNATTKVVKKSSIVPVDSPVSLWSWMGEMVDNVCGEITQTIEDASGALDDLFQTIENTAGVVEAMVVKTIEEVICGL